MRRINAHLLHKSITVLLKMTRSSTKLWVTEYSTNVHIIALQPLHLVTTNSELLQVVPVSIISHASHLTMIYNIY